MDSTSQMLSIRLSDEVFEKLRKYAEEHNETMSDSARRGIENLLSGSGGPVIQPPGNVLQEILEIKKQINYLSGREEETRRYISDLSWRLNELQGVLGTVLGLLAPYFPPPFPVPFPQFPLPPWIASADAQSASPAARSDDLK